MSSLSAQNVTNVAISVPNLTQSTELSGVKTPLISTYCTSHGMHCYLSLLESFCTEHIYMSGHGEGQFL